MNADRFKTSEIATEASRAVRARGWRSFVVGALIAITSGAALAGSFIDLQRIESLQAEQVYAGSNVVSVTPSSADRGNTLDAARCDGLRSIEGVRSAGAIMASYEVFSDASPSERFAIIEVTPGYLQLAYPRDSLIATASTVAGASVVDRLGMRSGATFASRSRDGRQAFSIPIDEATNEPARREPFDRAVMIAVAGTGNVFECLVEAQPGKIDAVSAATQSWFAPIAVTVRPELPNNSLAADPAAELTTRFSQWLPIALGAALVIVTLSSWWGRRADYAIYRAFGLSVAQLALFLTVETAITLWLPVIIGANMALFALAQWIPPASAGRMISDYLALLLTVGLVPLIGTFLLSRKSAFDVAKGQ